MSDQTPPAKLERTVDGTPETPVRRENEIITGESALEHIAGRTKHHRVLDYRGRNILWLLPPSSSEVMKKNAKVVGCKKKGF